MPDSDTSQKTHASLIDGLILRDPRSWSQMVDLYGPLIAFWCQRCGLDSHSTSDMVQEVFLAVSQAIGRYSKIEGKGGFRSWLWMVTRNKIIDRHRSQELETKARGGSSALLQIAKVPDPSSLIPSDEPTNEIAMSELMQRAILQVEVEFEARSWRAFWRTAVDGMPTDVVANELGISPAGVRQARSRILRRLRLQLGDLNAGADALESN